MEAETEPIYAVCARVADMDNPVEGSTPDKCAHCDQDVWISRSTRLFVQESEATIICAHCGKREMEKEMAEKGAIEIVTTDAQKNDLMHMLLEERL